MAIKDIPADKLNPTIEKIAQYVDSWNEFTFSYKGKTYTVLGGAIYTDRLNRLCLWADVIAIDREPQNIVSPKDFYIEGLESQVDRGKMHGRRYSDNTSIELSVAVYHAHGPLLEYRQDRSRKSRANAKPSGDEGCKDKARIARAKLDSLFHS